MTTAEVLDQLTALSLRDRLTVLETALRRIREELSALGIAGAAPLDSGPAAPPAAPASAGREADVEAAFAQRFPRLPGLDQGALHDDPTLPLAPADWGSWADEAPPRYVCPALVGAGAEQALVIGKSGAQQPRG